MARLPRVVVTHWTHPEALAYLAGFCEPVAPGPAPGVWSRAEVLDRAATAEGLLVCMADSVDDEFLAACPRLRVISAALKGYDNFDAEACARRGVWLTILPDLLTEPTAELAIGLTIAVMRQVPAADRAVRGGDFAGWRPRFYGAGLAGATVGILGMGRLGQALAERLAGFSVTVRYADPRPLDPERERALGVHRSSTTELLRRSDVVLPLLPLTRQTRGLIDARALREFKPGAYLVNIGRGSVVDEEAVADALEAGTLAGYAADVFAMEDWLLPGRPDRIPARLLENPRTVFTPHLGSAVDGVRREMSLAAARQLRQALSGQRPDHAVNDPAR
ncbi:NAD(P)-dependent oxidoreductase [Amycolatopsis anabasis]|uniref:NAD(P)-dependent oxidoreductase n=1 Tax=Amycolatopsis anabasis TaxID=1840409 RepID=UPI00131DA53E|nr:NAD(P)-dependent oxidoreductase [Amycolatopsis anabasis]